MLIAALVLGLAGGIIGIFFGFAFYAAHAGVAALTGDSMQTVLQIVSIAAPIGSIIGGALALARPTPAAVLMLLGAIGMFLAFGGFSSWTAIPMVLAAVGGLVALTSTGQTPRPAPPRVDT